MRFNKLDYCQYFLSSPINYNTVTNMADHLEGISHDRINRYLKQLTGVGRCILKYEFRVI